MNFNLVEYLKQLNKEFGVLYYSPNPGNAGDAIIALGTFHFFEKHNIKYEYINDPLSFNSENKLVAYGGGGNLVKNYNHAKKFIKKHAAKANKFVVLPHTVNDHKELLENLPSTVDIIVREQISYNYLKDINMAANVYLSHDMAFHLDINKILSFKTKSPIHILLLKVFYKLIASKKGSELPNYNKYVQSINHEQQLIQLTKKSTPDTLVCFREDEEKTDIDLPVNNIDLSQVYMFGTHNLGLLNYSTYKFVNLINKFSVVRTNRLHVAITASILGKEVYLYANNYYKNKAIYEHSLKNEFPNTHFVD